MRAISIHVKSSCYVIAIHACVQVLLGSAMRSQMTRS